MPYFNTDSFIDNGLRAHSEINSQFLSVEAPGWKGAKTQ